VTETAAVALPEGGRGVLAGPWQAGGLVCRCCMACLCVVLLVVAKSPPLGAEQVCYLTSARNQIFWAGVWVVQARHPN
jgi:hypothetical protein